MAALHPQNWPTSAWILLLCGLTYALGVLLWRPAFPKNAPKLVEAYPILGALRFFSARSDFMTEHARKSSSGQYSFYFGKLRIIGLSGEDGRKTFFESRNLNFTEGYAVLFNAAPRVDVDTERTSEERFSEKMRKNFVRLMRRENLITRLPLLLTDSRDTMERLANEPVMVMDPFQDLYQLVFQLTLRTVGCDEIAEDEAMMAKTLRIFEAIDSASTGAKLLFPWIPTLGHLNRLWSGTQMYLILGKIIEQRKKNGVKGRDALQMCMDQGDSTVEVVAFVIGALFAGLINSGINAAWLLCYLSLDPHWYTQIQQEVDAAVAKHRTSEDESPAEVLKKLTMDDWEADFPLIDLALKETIRLTMSGCGFRRNVSGKDVPIGASGEVIPNDAFAVYLMDDTNMNSEIYPDPLRWDPGRYLPERQEDKKIAAHGYVGWGSGLHPCVGMKFAKMEIAVTTAMFVASFDFQLCDKGGKPSSILPTQINRNKHSAHKPAVPMYLKYQSRT